MLGVGKKFNRGREQSRPGVYMDYFNEGNDVQLPPKGDAFIVIQAPVGLSNEVVTVRTPDEARQAFGKGKGVDTVVAALEAGVLRAHVVRIGEGGEVAAFTDTNPGVSIETKYPTGSEITLEETETLIGAHVLTVYSDGVLLEQLEYKSAEQFAKGQVESKHLNIKVEEGSEGPLLSTNLVTATGSPETISEATYIDAFAKGELVHWDVMLVDTENEAIQLGVHTFVKRVFDSGRRVFTVLAADTENSKDKRIEMPKMFNDFLVVLVGNGFKAKGKDYIGATAAAVVAGMIVSNDYKYNASFKVVKGAVEVLDPLTDSQYDDAADNGLLVFAYNRNGDVKIDYGINTLTTFDEIDDKGWRSIRRMRTRYELFDRILYKVEHTMEVGRGMSEDDLKHIITIGNGVIAEMINEGGLESGEMIFDPEFPPTGDSAWYTFKDLKDLDGLNKAYISFPFSF